MLWLLLFIVAVAIVWYVIVAAAMTNNKICLPNDLMWFLLITAATYVVLAGIIIAVVYRLKTITSTSFVVIVGSFVAGLALGITVAVKRFVEFCAEANASYIQKLEKLGLWFLIYWGIPVVFSAIILWRQQQSEKIAMPSNIASYLQM